MVTKKPRILLTLEESLLNHIDDFRYENRIPSRTEAIRRLIKEALKKYEKKGYTFQSTKVKDWGWENEISPQEMERLSSDGSVKRIVRMRHKEKE